MVLADVNALLQAGCVIQKRRLACKGKRQSEISCGLTHYVRDHHAVKTHQRLVPQLLR
jgi:hypothetical protein